MSESVLIWCIPVLVLVPLAIAVACSRTPTVEEPVEPPPAADTQLGLGIAYGNTLIYMSHEELATTLDDAVALGATWVRADFSWASVAPDGPQDYLWADLDRVVAEVNRRGLKLLPVLAYTPPWARMAGCDSEKCAPADPAQFARFAHDAAVRYTPAGVTTWQIWNEPNIAAFWQPGPSARAYTSLLSAVSESIRRVTPTAFIVMGGLANDGPALADRSANEFAADSLRLGAAAYIDAIAVHPYTYPYVPSKLGAWVSPWARDPRAGLVRLHEILADAGVPDMQIWITEYGAPTGGDRAESDGSPESLVSGPDHVTEEQQARIAVDAIRLANSDRSVHALMWYSYRDTGLDTPTNENYFGLLRADGSQKPAYAALRDVISTIRR